MAKLRRPVSTLSIEEASIAAVIKSDSQPVAKSTKHKAKTKSTAKSKSKSNTRAQCCAACGCKEMFVPANAWQKYHSKACGDSERHRQQRTRNKQLRELSDGVSASIIAGAVATNSSTPE